MALAIALAAGAAGVGRAREADADAVDPAEVVVTGTRVANRSARETLVPVDIISGESLRNAGVPEVAQALSIALPSLNFPRPGLTDGTDTIRPATLRALAPDQVLVLVNSKRRHSAALVNANNAIGRGSAAVDLNTIPAAMLRSVEVLRDGASAQYGSDAIAGVINLRLREDRDGGELTLGYGRRESSYRFLAGTPPANATWGTQASREASDGATVTLQGWKGLSFGERGFVTVAAEWKDQQRTERGGWDVRPQYPLLAGGAFDPREATFDRFNSWYGEPQLAQSTIFVNAGDTRANGVQLYGWASYQRREARSAGFYRRAVDERNTIEIYPDGFLPIIAPEVDDASVAGGATWSWGPWTIDGSLVYGRNEMAFTIENTLNRSLGASSGTRFDAGGFGYDQLVLDLSGVRQVGIDAFASPLNLAIGLEARTEGYWISAGEPDSYRNGGVLLPLGASGCTTPTAAQAAARGCATPSGSQVFPGFRPGNVIDADRTAVGAYVDLEATLARRLQASVALRAEDYSDFGSSVTGKLALRYEASAALALRAAAQTGFRAPSPQQRFFTATTTNFIGGVPFDITTFRVTDPIAQALGARPLEAEESQGFSVGAVLQAGRASLTIDAYRIDIDDRIVLSENLTAPNVRAYLTSLGFIGTGGGRFFINGVDTTTQGVDLVASVPLAAGPAGRLDFRLAANFNATEVRRVPQATRLAALDPAPVLFDRLYVMQFEKGQPEDKLNASLDWQRGRLGATLRATRYGDAVFNDGNNPGNDLLMSSRTLVDLELRLALADGLRFALGAENLADAYPESLPPATLNTTGTSAFPNYSPFGRSGRFVYVRATLGF